ncbi:MAG: sodium:proton antiporter [Verrucomicrobiota bacterium]
MEIFELIALLLTVTAVFGYVNARVNRFPTTIGVMLFALLFSVALILLGSIFPSVRESATNIVAQVDFNEALMQTMLCFLLFAGALHVNLDDLRQQRRVIGIMASVGVVLSTAIIGTGTWFLLGAFGIEVRYIEALLFGALISPTDPVAVLGILKKVGVKKTLETKITGESLFNDGIGVVVFLAILGIATSPDGHVSGGHIVHILLVEVVGGIVFGLVLGGLGYWMLRRIENYQVEVLITLAIVAGGYALAMRLHTSGPLAVVVAGLMIGNHGRTLAMSKKTREHLDKFWELVDEILNAVLFVLIGLEVLILALDGSALLLGVLAIPLVLAARFTAVCSTVGILAKFRPFSKGAVPIMTWGGLRGGISVALALALPAEFIEARDILLTMTYVVVIFSIAVQGLTLRRVIAKFA